MQKSRALYPHPFSRAYWRDAASELKDTKMLVVTALLTALRIAMKPLAIPLAPQLSIQTAMLATALGAMIFGPVVAIPAAMISDTIGFFLYPTGDYFLPFMLTEIASTMIYALCLYRCKVTPTRVMLSRFFICLFVNIVLQQLIFAWWYVYTGSDAKDALKFTGKQIATLAVLLVVGCGCAFGYMQYYYNTTNLIVGSSDEYRYGENTTVAQAVADSDPAYADETLVAIVTKSSKKFLGSEMHYTAICYRVNPEGLSAYSLTGCETDEQKLEAIRAMSKTPASKAAEAGALEEIGTATVAINEKTGQVISCQLEK